MSQYTTKPSMDVNRTLLMRKQEIVGHTEGEGHAALAAELVRLKNESDAKKASETTNRGGDAGGE